MPAEKDFNTLLLAASVLVAGNAAAGKYEDFRDDEIPLDLKRAFNLVSRAEPDLRKLLADQSRPIEPNI